MYKKLIYIVFFVSLHAVAQEQEALALKTYSFEEVSALQLQEKKPVVVFIHTEWCKFCLAMKQNTFTNKEIINMLNTHYYFISFDAESKKDITFNSHTFKFKPTGDNTGVHELAVALTDNKLTYPATIVLSPNNEIRFQSTNFLSSKGLLKTLKQAVQISYK